jgi:predicted RNA-binding protein associated with RNAse of E/G family
MTDFEPKFLHQKRVHAHRPGWTRLIKRQFTLVPLNEGGLNGYISLLRMEQVRSPLIKTINEKPITIIGDGFSWLQYYLTGCDYSAVATLNQDGKLVQWYLDVISAMGVDEVGYPWYDDLYLDVVATPDGWVEIIDGNDLDLALQNKAIDQLMHHHAWKTAERLADELHKGVFALSQRVEKDRENLLEQAPLLVGNW